MLPCDSLEFGCIFYKYITFTFRHILEMSQFWALSHSDFRKNLVSHTGEKLLELTPSLGSHALFPIFCLAGIGQCTKTEVAVQRVGWSLLDEREGTHPASFSELFCLFVLNLVKISFWLQKNVCDVIEP